MLFAGYLHKKVEYYDTNKTGEIISVMEKDVNLASQTFTDILAAGLRSLNSCFNGSILLFSISPRLCAVSLAVVPFVGVGAMYIHRYTKKCQEALRCAESRLLSFVIERFDNVVTVRLNQREGKEVDNYSHSAEDCYELGRNAHMSQGNKLLIVYDQCILHEYVPCPSYSSVVLMLLFRDRVKNELYWLCHKYIFNEYIGGGWKYAGEERYDCW